MTRLVHRRSHRFLIAREDGGTLHLASAKAREIASNLGNRRRKKPLRQAAFLTILPFHDLMRAEIIRGRI